MRNKISAVIITLNEEDNIERCIHSLKRITNDIIVVDAQSTDRTVKKARKLGANVSIVKWEGYGQNKNYGNELASHNWILSIDADEILNDQLVDSLLNLKLKDNTIYSMLNQLNFCGHWVKYTDWHPSYKRRLFNRVHTSWNEDDVHEGLKTYSNTLNQKIPGKILHYGYKTKDELNLKTDQYARLSAKLMFNKGKKPSLVKYYFGPSFRFFKSYVLQFGVLDGKSGFQICKMNAKLVRLRNRYVRELYRK